jgi:hypothetical protein
MRSKHTPHLCDTWSLTVNKHRDGGREMAVRNGLNLGQRKTK